MYVCTLKRTIHAYEGWRLSVLLKACWWRNKLHLYFLNGLLDYARNGSPIAAYCLQCGKQKQWGTYIWELIGLSCCIFSGILGMSLYFTIFYGILMVFQKFRTYKERLKLRSAINSFYPIYTYVQFYQILQI